MWRTWSNSLVPATPAARLVLSERGESLSPKEAPVTTAPAAMAGGIPKPAAMPMAAAPMVPAVVQALPVDTAMMAQMTGSRARNTLGEKSLRP